MMDIFQTIARTALRGLLTLPLLTLAPISMAAEQEARRTAQQPTTLGEVITSSLQHFPQILAAQAQIEASEAMALAARGSFDARIDGGVDSRLAGYYSGRSGEAVLSQQLQSSNTRLFAGYRVGAGSYPLYDNSALTRDAGEFRVGVELALLRDRDIDERRGAVATSELQVLSELQQFTAAQLDVMQSAYIAYAQWLLAGRLLDAWQDLLDMAVERGTALERSVAAGDAAEILLVENAQAVLQRRGLVVDARRQVDMAAELLALYLRDEQGNSLYPRYAPDLQMPVEDPADFSVPVPDLLAAVLEQRPEIAALKLAQSQLAIRKQLAENLARPRLDLRLYAARDFGSGPPNLAGTDNVADLSFSIPLGTREARGKAAAAQAEIEGMEHGIRLLGDRIEVDLRRALVNLAATRQMEAFASEELQLSETLAAAERQRFAAGLSDFFMVNIRERQVGEAQLTRWQAHFSHQLALADFYALSMDMEGLGYTGAGSVQ